MSSVLVTYYSRTGNTERMAEHVAEGGEEAGGQVRLASVDKIDASELTDYDAIIVGSPTYYGSMAAEVKELIDESVQLHGQLSGRVGAAFASSAHVGGGNETTALDLIHAFLIHGMVVPGIYDGDHYGPVSVGEPDSRVRQQCEQLGERVVELATKLAQ